MCFGAILAARVVAQVGQLPRPPPVRPSFLTRHGLGNVAVSFFPVVRHPLANHVDPHEPENDDADDVEETQARSNQAGNYQEYR